MVYKQTYYFLSLEIQWHPTPVLLPGESHGRRNLVSCSPWGREESDTTEWLHFEFSLSCIGEGNGNPFQCSCLENPRGGGAWWAAICGVAQSWTRLKWLSSSRDSIWFFCNLFFIITWTGNSFHTWYFTCFNAILPNLPTLSLSHRVHKTVLKKHKQNICCVY